MPDEIQGDQGSEAVEEVGQSSQVEQTQPVSDQAETSTVAQSSEIVVGNQKFKDLQELVKAYSELQGGFTKKTQEYSNKLKAYEGFSSWLSELRKDNDKWGRFVSYVRGGGTEQAQPQQAQRPQAPQPSQRDEQFEALDRQQQEINAAVEYLDFKSSHADIGEDVLKEVVTLAADKADEGENWSLEMCYRWLMADKGQQAKLVEKGQSQVTEALEKSKSAARSLGAAPSAPQAQAQAKAQAANRKPWTKMSERDQRNAIARKMDELGIKFDED